MLCSFGCRSDSVNFTFSIAFELAKVSSADQPDIMQDRSFIGIVYEYFMQSWNLQFFQTHKNYPNLKHSAIIISSNKLYVVFSN